MLAVHDAAGRPKSLLVVSLLQFGVHTDTVKYCERLRGRWRVTCLCLESGLPRLELDGVDVVYCTRRPLGKAELGLFLDTLRLLRSRAFDLVFLRRTKYSFLLRLVHLRLPMVFDVRSGSIEDGAAVRIVEDTLTWFNARFFRHITVISRGLARRLRLPGRAHVLPLGADPAPELTHRIPGELRLVYIGTFKGRRLERTVLGLRAFLDDGGNPRCRYSIIGFGPQPDTERLRRVVVDTGLADIISIEGRIGHAEVSSVLAGYDVGVAFTPRAPWYEHQPSTKIFEYLAAGLLCIATDSAANREIVTPDTGVLIDGTAESFRAGLHEIAALLPASDPRRVAEAVRDHNYGRIIDDNLAPYLERAAQ